MINGSRHHIATHHIVASAARVRAATESFSSEIPGSMTKCLAHRRVRLPTRITCARPRACTRGIDGHLQGPEEFARRDVNLNMAILATDIERALDDIVSNEHDVRFQRLATVLAQDRWPDLIASERKRDLGRDALASAALAKDQSKTALACSITASLTKVRADVEKNCREIATVSTIVFSTPCRVTGQWAAAIRDKYGLSSSFNQEKTSLSAY
jgi:hypothetical protein